MSDLDACLLARFAGRQPPDWLRRWLDDGLGGVLLSASNIAGPGQVRALAAELRSHNPRVLIAADEEGGGVTTLEARTGSSYPGNAALGAVDDTTLTGRPLVVAVRDAHRLPWQRDLLGPADGAGHDVAELSP
jgi:beta-glucosidase-like glycosyl hydrolase